MNRERFEELLDDWARGRLAADEAAAFERALAGDPDLEAEARDHRRLLAAIESAPRAAAPAGLLAGALARARAVGFEDDDEDETPAAPPAVVVEVRALPRKWFYGAAAAAVLVLGGVGAWQLRPLVEEPSLAQSPTRALSDSMARGEAAARLQALADAFDEPLLLPDSADDAFDPAVRERRFIPEATGEGAFAPASEMRLAEPLVAGQVVEGGDDAFGFFAFAEAPPAREAEPAPPAAAPGGFAVADAPRVPEPVPAPMIDAEAPAPETAIAQAPERATPATPRLGRAEPAPSPARRVVAAPPTPRLDEGSALAIAAGFRPAAESTGPVSDAAVPPIPSHELEHLLLQAARAGGALAPATANSIERLSGAAGPWIADDAANAAAITHLMIAFPSRDAYNAFRMNLRIVPMILPGEPVAVVSNEAGAARSRAAGAFPARPTPTPLALRQPPPGAISNIAGAAAPPSYHPPRARLEPFDEDAFIFSPVPDPASGELVVLISPKPG